MRNSGDVHLLATEDESLLNWRDTLLLLDALLYPGDLFPWKMSVNMTLRYVVFEAELVVASCGPGDEAFPCDLS